MHTYEFPDICDSFDKHYVSAYIGVEGGGGREP